MGYDGLGRLSQITGDDGKAWTYRYDEVGNKRRLIRPNGVITGYAYDTLNRLTALANVRGTEAEAEAGTAQAVSRFDYRLREDGRRDRLSETLAQPDGTTRTRSVSYEFDDANRLRRESGTDGAGRDYAKSYVLDDAGNRLSLTTRQEQSDGSFKNATISYSYNDLDWMTSQSVQDEDGTRATNYAYDANGSQIGITSNAGTPQAALVRQVWDFEGHLRAQGQVESDGSWKGSRTSYSYDAAGMRIAQSTLSEAGTVTDGTSYLWNDDRVVEERDEKGVLTAAYEHGQELGPLRLRRPATATLAQQTRYFIGDGQDSTRQLLDSSGQVKDSYFYDSFGIGLGGGQGASVNSFRYTGQQLDNSGLYYLRARYYDAGSGRFLSHDPVMGFSDDPITMHRYLYANANPVNFVDPSGRMLEGIAGLMTAISLTMKVYDGVSAIGNAVGAGMEFALATRDIQSGTGSPGMHLALGALHTAHAALNVMSLLSPIPTFGGGPGNFGGPDAVMALGSITLRQATAFATAVGARSLSAGVNGVMARNLEAYLLMMDDGTGAAADAPYLAPALEKYPVGSAGGRFEGFFTAVFNSKDKRIAIRPNLGINFQDLPEGFVPRNGGHIRIAQEEFGFSPQIDPRTYEITNFHQNLFGFVFQRGANGGIIIRGWRSGGVNGSNNSFDGVSVPKENQAEIMEYLERATGKTVTVAP